MRTLCVMLIAICALPLSLSLSAKDAMPKVNNYNCYAHILPIDRDFHTFAQRCRAQKLGKANEEYSALASQKAVSCYINVDDSECQAQTQALRSLIEGWKHEDGAIEVYRL